MFNKSTSISEQDLQYLAAATILASADNSFGTQKNIEIAIAKAKMLRIAMALKEEENN